jgi:two-component system, LuxR family, response regulator FixJ
MPEKPLVAIVDDDESHRRATQSLLRSAGFSTAVFADAESFLSSAIRASAACLVADMRMPGMSGLELYQALVASGDGIPTILITAYANDDTRLRARNAGITCFLGKPFAADDLLECIQNALAQPRPGRTIPRS